MNNMRFTDVLEQWNERVIHKSDKNRAAVLQKQHDEICRLMDYRNALVHGMWEWRDDQLDTITTTRIRKKEIISIKVKSDDLVDLYTQIARINFQIRYPSGVEELLQEKMKQGSYISRRALSMFTDSDIADDWMTPLPGQSNDI